MVKTLGAQIFILIFRSCTFLTLPAVDTCRLILPLASKPTQYHRSCIPLPIHLPHRLDWPLRETQHSLLVLPTTQLKTHCTCYMCSTWACADQSRKAVRTGKRPKYLRPTRKKGKDAALQDCGTARLRSLTDSREKLQVRIFAGYLPILHELVLLRVTTSHAT